MTGCLALELTSVHDAEKTAGDDEDRVKVNAPTPAGMMPDGQVRAAQG